MSTAPVFSVVIPVHNRPELLKRAINSVLMQSFKDYEVVVVDDGSTSNIKAVCDEFQNDSVRYIRHDVNKGVAAARNTGIKAAEGPLISLLDSDDAYKEDFLLKTYSVYESADQNVGFFWTGVIKHRSEIAKDSQKHYIRKIIWTPSFQTKNEQYRYCLENDALWGTGFGVTVKKEVFEKIGYFNESLKAREDMEILIRLMKNSKFKVVEDFLIDIYTDADVRVDEQAINRANAYVAMLDWYKDDIQLRTNSKVFFYSMISQSYYSAGVASKSYFYLLKAFKADPRNKDLIKLFIKQTLFVHRILFN